MGDDRSTGRRRADRRGRATWRTGGTAAAIAFLLAPTLAASAPLDPVPTAAESAPNGDRVPGALVGIDAPLSVCTGPHADEYYSFPLNPTGKVAAAADADGRVTVGFADSPFALAMTRDGRISRQLEVSLDAPAPANGGVYVAWVADPDLSTVVRLGTLGGDRKATGIASLNKFLIFVTVEPNDDPDATAWQGPVALVGRSRSARIQSMASHGSFETEDC